MVVNTIKKYNEVDKNMFYKIMSNNAITKYKPSKIFNWMWKRGKC